MECSVLTHRAPGAPITLFRLFPTEVKDTQWTQSFGSFLVVYVEHIHTVQLSISRTVIFSKETHATLISHVLFLQLLAHPPPYFGVWESHYSKYHIQMESSIICSFMSGLFNLCLHGSSNSIHQNSLVFHSFLHWWARRSFLLLYTILWTQISKCHLQLWSSFPESLSHMEILPESTKC